MADTYESLQEAIIAGDGPRARELAERLLEAGQAPARSSMPACCPGWTSSAGACAKASASYPRCC